mmetsp:Transcript_6286/g.14643  ORF Transcript_6286/g.14643 Transcript_6286/m.14643 type:complete len:81 (+) Transcript_6286:302-544(+)
METRGRKKKKRRKEGKERKDQEKGVLASVSARVRVALPSTQRGRSTRVHHTRRQTHGEEEEEKKNRDEEKAEAEEWMRTQ